MVVVMERAAQTSANALNICGWRVRRELRRHYGSPEAAERAIREVAEDTKSLEEWASVVTLSVWRLSEMPPPIREAATVCLAAAMLAWTADQEREAS